MQETGWFSRGKKVVSGFEAGARDTAWWLMCVPPKPPISCGKKLIKLFDETVRILKPGGVAIFETPNPQNLLMSSSNFYLDPTHRNPLPSPLIKFVAEARCLHQVKILDLHPYPAHFRVSGSDIAERFNDYFYGPQDYAVIGYKI